jgi:hypothetical protein
MTIEKRPMIEKAKRIAALLLLAASLLPLAQCSRNEKEPVNSSSREAQIATLQQEHSAHHAMGRPIYVWHEFKPLELDSWPFALAFVWPIPLLIARWKLPFKYLNAITLLLKIPLCGFTAYLLYCFVGDPLWQILSGGYVAVIGTVLYISAILTNVSNWLRNHNWN